MSGVAVTCRGIRRPAWTAACARFCRKVLKKLGKDDWEVSLLFCDDEYIRSLNARFRGQDRPTDVLSFPQAEGDLVPGPADGPVAAGDIVISLERLAANAREFGVTRNEELKRLLVHGLLHLAGRDHATNDQGEPMLAAQEALLRELKKERIR